MMGFFSFIGIITTVIVLYIIYKANTSSNNNLPDTQYNREQNMKFYFRKFYEHKIVETIQNGKLRNTPMMGTEVLTVMDTIHKGLINSSFDISRDYRIPEYRVREILQEVFQEIRSETFTNI